MTKSSIDAQCFDMMGVKFFGEEESGGHGSEIVKCLDKVYFLISYLPISLSRLGISNRKGGKV